MRLNVINIASASSGGSNVSVHMRRLVRAFAARIHEVLLKMKTQTDNKSMEDGKDQESMQSSTTPDQDTISRCIRLHGH